MVEIGEITRDSEADWRIKRSPFPMRRSIRKRTEEWAASCERNHLTESGVYRRYRFE